MLLAFYSTLIIFLLLFLVSSAYLLAIFNRKTSAIGKPFILTILLILSLTITCIYGYDFIHLKRDNTKYTSGICLVQFIRGGKSIDTTEVTIKDKIYKIKSEKYSDLPDGTYSCELRYLPLTKIVFESNIK